MSLTVVIPTLNESVALPETLRTLVQRAQDPGRLDLILVDAGSQDRTAQIGREWGLRVFVRPDFRFRKNLSLNHGLQQAQCPVVLFLDADTSLPHHFDARIRQAIESGCLGGAFAVVFDDPSWIYRVLAYINHLRYRWRPVFHGDQGFFCRRDAALNHGGFPEEPLMETAYFCRKLRRAGRLCLIPQPVTTSARRFQQNGLWRVIWFDLLLWIRFVAGLPTARFAERYWKAAKNGDQNSRDRAS